MNYNDEDRKKKVELLEEFIYSAMLPEILKVEKNAKNNVKCFDFKELFRRICKCSMKNQPEFATYLREDILNMAFYSVLDELNNQKIILKLPIDYTSTNINSIIEEQVQNADMQKIFKFMEKTYKEKGYYEFDLRKFVYEELPKNERTYETEQRLDSLFNQVVQVLFKAGLAKCVCDGYYVFHQDITDIESVVKNIYKDSHDALSKKVSEVCEGKSKVNKGFYDQRLEETLKTIYNFAKSSSNERDVQIQALHDDFAVVDSEKLKKNMLEISVNSLTSVLNDYLLDGEVERFLFENSKLYNELCSKQSNGEPAV